MIRSAKDFTASNQAAAAALETCATIVQNYATHKDESCVDGWDKCACGLNTFKLIAESRLEAFKVALLRISEG